MQVQRRPYNSLHPDYRAAWQQQHWRSHSMYVDKRRSGSLQRRQLPATPDQLRRVNDNTPLPPGFYSGRLHRKVYEIRSAEFRTSPQAASPTATDWSSRSTPDSPLNPRPRSQSRTFAGASSPRTSSPMWQHAPARSQSFRHRPRPPVEVRRNVLEDVSQERRRSTPTVSRRCSLQRSRIELPRTDVWPEPKQMSEVEERFLRLPDSEDYTRVRQFRIDKKGAVVSRGDSFRRKKNKSDNSPSPFPQSESESPRGTSSRSPSVSSLAAALATANGTAVPNGHKAEASPTATEEEPSTSHLSYKIQLLGQAGSGKSSLIAQFITSEYRNAFADEVEESETTVSICIGGTECELVFLEADPTVTDDWKSEEVQAYLLVYSIDSKSSFRTVMGCVEDLRAVGSHTPIILAGNKVDLERKRAIAAADVRSAAHQFGLAHFEISVALNHDVDELLVGIVAEIKESYNRSPRPVEQENRPLTARSDSINEPEEFHAAIRRFSQRKKRQMGGPVVEVESGKCANLKPAGFFAKLRNWRRGTKC